MRWMSSALVRSAGTASTSVPVRPRISSAAVITSAVVRAHIVIRAPSAASISAAARPITRLDAVTMATFPVRPRSMDVSFPADLPVNGMGTCPGSVDYTRHLFRFKTHPLSPPRLGWPHPIRGFHWQTDAAGLSRTPVGIRNGGLTPLGDLYILRRAWARCRLQTHNRAADPA